MDLFQNRFPSSGFLAQDFKRLMSSCSFSHKISFIRFLVSDDFYLLWNLTASYV